MSLIKEVTQKELPFTAPPSYIQLTLKVENAAAIKDLEEFFKQSVACLHLRLKDQYHLVYWKICWNEFHSPN